MHLLLLPLVLILLQEDPDIKLSGGNILSCETYSLHRMFRAREMTLEEFPAVMKKLGIRGVALNDLYFMSWEEAYLQKIKVAIRKHDRVVTAFIIDHHGDFSVEDEEQRTKNVEAVKKRLETAKFLGAPVVRINVGRNKAGAAHVVKAFQTLVPVAEKLDLTLCIENHGGPSSTVEGLLDLIKKIGSPRVKACLDFQNWPKETDRYEACRKIAPRAAHVHAKARAFQESGEEKYVDYRKLLRIVKETKYAGAISIEFEGPGDLLEGVKKTRNLIRKHWPQN